MTRPTWTAALLMAIVTSLLLISSPAQAQRSARILVQVRIIAAPPSFTVALPTVGQSGGTVYGTVPFTLTSPGQKADSFTTMQTTGGRGSGNVILLPAQGSVVPLGGLPTTVAQRSASGIVTSVPRFEIGDAASLPATTVITSFGSGPEADAGSERHGTEQRAR